MRVPIKALADVRIGMRIIVLIKGGRRGCGEVGYAFARLRAQ
ncbi:hypothetical protein [Streptomyces antioxidans]|nr:hypothetical protein [Streptomyces antioxidans]